MSTAQYHQEIGPNKAETNSKRDGDKYTDLNGLRDPAVLYSLQLQLPGEVKSQPL